jgi:glycosyltransferase involved in cell wall biosynthesis
MSLVFPRGSIGSSSVISNRFIRDADIIIAESFPTAYAISNLYASKGEKVYLIHHYSPDEDASGIWLRSFSLPLYKIAVSEFTKRLIEERCGSIIWATVPNGVNTDIFHPHGRRSPDDPPKVLIYYAKGTRKGGKDAIAVARKLYESRPEILISMFGPHKSPSIPSFVKFHSKLTDLELAELYRSHHIFVYCSRFEGWGLPPLEAMACGCAVVTTNVGGVPEYARPYKNAIVCAPGDINCIVGEVLELLDKPSLCNKLMYQASEDARKHSWENSIDKLEHLLSRLVRRR